MTSLLSSLHPVPGHSPLGQQPDELHRVLVRLPRKVQQVFLLSRMDGLAYGVIAQRLELPLAKVENDMALSLIASQRASAREPAILAQACRWYVHLQNPTTTPSDRIEFRRWLDADGQHLAAFHETELHWRALLAPATALGASGWHRQPRMFWLRHKAGAWIGALLATLALLWMGWQ